MRTTLDIDDDILSAARELARAEGKTIGEVISKLAREALTTPTVSGLGEADQAKLDEWPIFPWRGGGRIVTPEMIDKIQAEIDVEESTPWDFETDKPREFDDHKSPTGKSPRRKPRRAR